MQSSEGVYIKKVQLQLANLLKKRLRHRCFPVNSTKILRTPVLQNIRLDLVGFSHMSVQKKIGQSLTIL